MLRLKARAAWGALCELAVSRTNGVWEEREQMLPGRAYLAPESMGDRGVTLLRGGDWQRSPLAHVVGDRETFAHWLGFAESDVLEVSWVSASSGAEIRARQGGAGWSLEYRGIEVGDRDVESWYLVDFLRAARKGSVEVVETDAGAKGRVEQALAGEENPARELAPTLLALL